MADTKISALPAASTPLTGSEVVPLNQSGVTSNVTVANLTAGRNVYANNFIPSVTTTTASSTPINLTVNSTQYQIVNGTTTSQQFNLPDATTLTVGDTFYFNNNLTISSVQVNAHDGSTSILALQAGGAAHVVLLTNSTTNGTWDVHSYIPSSTSWGTATLSFNNSSSISGTVSWNGNAIGTAYGGTGLSGSTPFTANGIVYASSSSALTTNTNLQFNNSTGVFSSYISGANSLLANFATTTYTTRGLRINSYQSVNGGSDCGINFDSGTGGYGGFKFSNSGTPLVTIDDANSNLTLNLGNLVQGTAAKGINFTSNTPKAGMTSQLLNWYEEGTWTPNQGSGIALVGTFSSTGYYTRIGRQVTVTGTLVGSTSVAANAGAVLTTNLPFTAGSAYTIGNASNAAQTSVYFVFNNPTTTYLYAGGAIVATTTIYFQMTYFV